MLRTIMASAALLVLGANVAASAAENAPILYPHDNSQRYAYGYSNIDFPVVYVQRGHSCSIMLEPGENLPPTDANGVLLDDRVRWVSVASRSGGGRLPNGHTVPIAWTVSVEPARDAHDAWLTIATDLGRHYLIHLVPVSEDNVKGQHLVGFYYYHEPPRMRVFRQARAAAVHPRQIATGHR
jgi:hypothetical protein